MYEVNLIIKLLCYFAKHGEGSIIFKDGCFIGLDPNDPLKVNTDFDHHKKDFVLVNPTNGTQIKVCGEKVFVSQINNQ